MSGAQGIHAAAQGPFLVFIDGDFHKQVQTLAECESIKMEADVKTGDSVAVTWVPTRVAAAGAELVATCKMALIASAAFMTARDKAKKKP